MITLSHQMIFSMCGKDYKEKTFAPFQTLSEICDIACGILCLIAAIVLTALKYPYIACGFYAAWAITLPIGGLIGISIIKQIRFWKEFND